LSIQIVSESASLGWAVSHSFVVGEIADVVLLAIGAFTAGAGTWKVGNVGGALCYQVAFTNNQSSGASGSW
jgi:hypothetical protein